MKTKAYLYIIFGVFCFMFIGVGYIVSYTDQASLKIFNIESRLVIISLLIFLPIAGFYSIRKGLILLK